MDRSPSLLQIRLLGGFELRSDRAPEVPPLGRKIRALVACVALSSGSSSSREKLMARLWSDRSEAQARASLRQALTELRRALGEPSPLRTERDAVSLDPTLVTVDALEFERLAKAGKLSEAAALYRGPLLDGHGVRDGAFEEWLLPERTRLHDRAVDVLDRVVASQSGNGAIATAQRLLQLDPTREETHRSLMRLYFASDRRAQALRQYQHCRETLQRELGAPPDAETECLYRQILDETMPPSSTTVDATEPEAALRPSGKPSVAVLRFTNMSGDPSQQYFSDGITEDIITELSRYRSLLVIVSNPSLQIGPSDAERGAVRQKQSVRYIVSGSVRRSRDRLRVTAQLIDAATETHLWAEHYDCDIKDAIADQDEIARTIAATLEGRVAASGIENAKRKPARDLAAYDLFLRGRERDAYFDLVGAESFFARAIELDPGYVHAHAFRAMALAVQYWLGQGPEKLQRAEDCARTALALDNHDAASHDAMGYVAMHQRKFDLAGMHLDRAVSLNPNDVYILADRANLLVRTGRPADALRDLEAGMQRDPFSPIWLWEVRCNALFHLKRYDEAIAALRNMSVFQFWHYAHFAAAYAHAGRPDDAQRELTTFRQARPDATIALVAAAEPYATSALLDHLLDGLRKAGLPE
jgi:TolB-like protein